MARRGPARLVHSPAACLLPQLEETARRQARVRRRRIETDGVPDDSPGRLYTYFSAGTLQLPEEERDRRLRVRRSPRLALALLGLLALIWACWR